MITAPFLTEECEYTQGLDPRWCGLCAHNQLSHLFVLQECDDNDRKLSGVFFVLCARCIRARIESHPRLYHEHGISAPAPGAMPLCADCGFRAGTFCLHPQSSYRGGTGLSLTYPAPARVFVQRKGGGRESAPVYMGPVTHCTGKTTYQPTRF